MAVLMEKREIPVKGEYDVIVAGAGVAGLAAALAAKRAGMRVLLLEKSMELGGLATLGHVNYYVPMCNGRGIQIIRGMVDEFVELAVRYGYDVRHEEWRDGRTPEGMNNPPRYDVRYSACMFALALTELIHAEGIDLSFDTIASEPVMEGKHCCGLIVENKSGRQFYAASVVIDATGDADILYRAGVPCVQGGNYHTYVAYALDLEHCRMASEHGRIHEAVYNVAGGWADLYGGGHPEGMPLYTGTSGEDVNRYLITNQIEMLNQLKKDDPNSRQVIALPGMCQFRTTRCIEGDYILQESDAYRHFEDSIAAINDFDRRDYLYEVPYRTLIRSGFDNLLTAGRSASAAGYAWDVLRVIPPAILTGQAAGCAAAQAVRTGCAVTELDVSALQKTLERQNVLIHFDDSWVPESGGGERVETGHI